MFIKDYQVWESDIARGHTSVNKYLHSFNPCDNIIEAKIPVCPYRGLIKELEILLSFYGGQVKNSRYFSRYEFSGGGRGKGVSQI